MLGQRRLPTNVKIGAASTTAYNQLISMYLGALWGLGWKDPRLPTDLPGYTKRGLRGRRSLVASFDRFRLWLLSLLGWRFG
jgi:hypothetical protein